MLHGSGGLALLIKKPRFVLVFYSKGDKFEPHAKIQSF